MKREPNAKPARFSLRYLLVLIAACGMMATAVGILCNAFGVFILPIAEDLGLGQGAVSLMQTISNLCMAFSGMLTITLIRKWRLKPILLAAALLMAGTTAGLGLSGSLPMLYLFSGIRGFVGGIVGNVLVVTVINNWFIKNNGTFVSLALSMSGITGAVISPVFASVIQQYGWRTGFFVMAALVLVLELPGILSPIDVHPSRVGYLAYGETEPAGNVAQPAEAKGKGTSTLLFLPILLISVYQLVVAYTTSYPQYYPGIASRLGLPATTGALLVSVCMVVNTAGKLSLGILADRIGARKAVTLVSALVLLGPVFLLLGKPWGLFPSALLIGFSYSLSTVGSVLLVREAFGEEQYSRVYPKTVLLGTMSGAMGIALVGFLFDATGSYRLSFLLVQGLLVLEFASVLLLFRYIAARRKAETAEPLGE